MNEEREFPMIANPVRNFHLRPVAGFLSAAILLGSIGTAFAQTGDPYDQPTAQRALAQLTPQPTATLQPTARPAATPSTPLVRIVDNPYSPMGVTVFGGNYVNFVEASLAKPPKVAEADLAPNRLTYPAGVYTPRSGDGGFRCGQRIYGSRLYPRCDGAGVN
ncbi:MAG: hypothetical protein HW416_249 [Chloroflexi bacterium]|nr:hypothetical protein [Chloroflexota bacterium]